MSWLLVLILARYVVTKWSWQQKKKKKKSNTFVGIQKEAFLFCKPSQNNQSQSPVYAGIFFMAAVPGLAATLLSSLDDMS